MPELGASIESYIAKCIADHMPSKERVEEIVREEAAKWAKVLADETMGMKQASKYLGLSEPKITGLYRDGELPGRFVGVYKFSKSALYQWLNKGDGPRMAAVVKARRVG